MWLAKCGPPESSSRYGYLEISLRLFENCPLDCKTLADTSKTVEIYIDKSRADSCRPVNLRRRIDPEIRGRRSSWEPTYVNRVQHLHKANSPSPTEQCQPSDQRHEAPAVLRRRRCRCTARTGALLLFPAAAVAEPGQSSTSTGNSAPNGLVVVIENKPQENRLNLRALNNPYISGVALQIRWRDIEPAQGNPDWSKLDQLFAAAEASKKWVQLLIFPGFFLLRGPWKAYRPKRSRFNMGPAKAQSRSFRCHGITPTLAVGSHS